MLRCQAECPNCKELEYFEFFNGFVSLWLGVWAAEGIENRIENFYLSERLRLHYFDPAKGSSTPENIVF